MICKTSYGVSLNHKHLLKFSYINKHCFGAVMNITHAVCLLNDNEDAEYSVLTFCTVNRWKANFIYFAYQFFVYKLPQDRLIICNLTSAYLIHILMIKGKSHLL